MHTHSIESVKRSSGHPERLDKLIIAELIQKLKSFPLLEVVRPVADDGLIKVMPQHESKEKREHLDCSSYVLSNCISLLNAISQYLITMRKIPFYFFVFKN